MKINKYNLTLFIAYELFFLFFSFTTMQHWGAGEYLSMTLFTQPLIIIILLSI